MAIKLKCENQIRYPTGRESEYWGQCRNKANYNVKYKEALRGRVVNMKVCKTHLNKFKNSLLEIIEINEL